MAEKPLAEKEPVMADTPIVAPIDSAAFMMSEDSMLVLTDAITDSVLRQLPAPKEKEQFVPDSHRALWLGLVFPGAGQIYNRKYWKLPIIYGGFLGCLYALNWNAQMYNDYRQAYLDIMDDDPNTHSYLDMLPIGYDITGKEDRFKEIFRRKKDYYRKYRDLSIFAMVGVWALSVIDAFVDAELSTFDISPNLSMRFAPSLFNSSDLAGNRAVINTGVSISLRVK
ncbi:MAG: hypothetical protein HUK01_08775 [Bacteroidaceae bacterium]|nr:hypothetical protein [Bacteroidaceae bacterium]